MYDTIIIGGGPAGLTAAIYLIRKKMKILLLTQKIGGQILDGPLMENFPGFEKITGLEFIQKVRAQAEKLGVQIKEGAEAKKIAETSDGFEISGAGFEPLKSKTILIASGKRPRKLNVKGEDKFLGKGISPCVTCDGPLFSNKTVAVIGGGNSAISAALELEKYTEKVYILNLGQNLIGEEVRLDKIKKSAKIEVIPQAKTSEIIGANFVEKLKYKGLSADRKDSKSGAEKEIAVSGIFIEIGWEPSTKYLENLVELTPLKEVKINDNNLTNVPGVFAAGDVTATKYKQAVIACGEGAKAALAAWEYLTGTRNKL